MAPGSESNHRRKRQRVENDDDHEDPPTPQGGSPSKKRLANIPKQAIEHESTFLRKIISPDSDDDEIRRQLNYVWTSFRNVLEHDPKLIKHLASKEEFRDNVTRKREKAFIESLRVMAANCDTQGSKAWVDLFEDGTSLSFVSKHSDRILCPEVFLKEMQAPEVDPLDQATGTSAQEGAQQLQSLFTLL